MPFAAAWMGLEVLILSSQAEKDKYHMIYVESWKKGTNEIIYQTESYRCKKHDYQGVRRWGGISWENGTDIYTQLYIT